MLIQFLRSALEQRHLFLFNYDEKPRIVEPHALGLNKKGELVLRGFQTNGDEPGWRLFILERAEHIGIGAQQFDGPRPGYRQGDKQMTEIFAELPEPALEVAA